jgi:hypothetical protein
VRQALWSKILALLTTEHDPESYAVDATYVRVHAHGTRARGGYLREAIGRSRGGLTSKVHLLVSRLFASGGNRPLGPPARRRRAPRARRHLRPR